MFTVSINEVNSLCGLLIITSLLVIETKKARWSAIFYSLQSLVLVLIFLSLAVLMQANQLYLWAASAFVTKAVLVPLILYRALSRVEEADMPKNAMSPVVAILIAAASVAVSFFVVDQIQIAAVAPFKPALAISIAHFFFGVLCILTQRNIYKQILGVCLMENGAHLTLALLAYNAPELVEVGIATDALFAVLIMVTLGSQIYRTLHTLDSSDLTMLKG
jgi:hydrogenase-4 component E